jgi:hypothetical protein
VYAQAGVLVVVADRFNPGSGAIDDDGVANELERVGVEPVPAQRGPALVGPVRTSWQGEVGRCRDLVDQVIVGESRAQAGGGSGGSGGRVKQDGVDGVPARARGLPD